MFRLFIYLNFLRERVVPILVMEDTLTETFDSTEMASTQFTVLRTRKVAHCFCANYFIPFQDTYMFKPPSQQSKTSILSIQFHLSKVDVFAEWQIVQITRRYGTNLRIMKTLRREILNRTSRYTVEKNQRMTGQLRQDLFEGGGGGG